MKDPFFLEMERGGLLADTSQETVQGDNGVFRSLLKEIDSQVSG